MPAQHIFTTEVKQVVIMMSQTQIKFLMLLNEKAYSMSYSYIGASLVCEMEYALSCSKEEGLTLMKDSPRLSSSCYPVTIPFD